MNSAGIVTYLDYARQICGTSHIIYADGGTENGNVLAIHFFQRVTRNDLRGEKRFMRRRSRANQIIISRLGGEFSGNNVLTFRI